MLIRPRVEIRINRFVLEAPVDIVRKQQTLKPVNSSPAPLLDCGSSASGLQQLDHRCTILARLRQRRPIVYVL